MRSPILAAIAVASLMVTATSCSDDGDVFPRDEYVKAVTDSGVTKAVAECAYDRFKDDESIMAELIRADGPNDNVSDKVASEMSNALARCIIAAEDAKNPPVTTTTKPKATTTTTAKPRPTTTSKARTTTTTRSRSTTTTRSRSTTTEPDE